MQYTPSDLKPRERYYDELVNPRADDPDAKRQAGQYRAEIHERFSNPFYSFAFVLIAVAFIGRAQSTRQNRWESTASAGALAIGARMAGLAANNLVVLNAKWVPVLYVIPLGMILIGCLMIHFGARPRRGPTLFGRIAAGLSVLWALLPSRQRLVPGQLRP